MKELITFRKYLNEGDIKEDDLDDLIKMLDDFYEEEGIKKTPKKPRKPGELGDLNHADGTPKSNDELDAELNDEIDDLSKLLGL